MGFKQEKSEKLGDSSALILLTLFLKSLSLLVMDLLNLLGLVFGLLSVSVSKLVVESQKAAPLSESVVPGVGDSNLR